MNRTIIILAIEFAAFFALAIILFKIVRKDLKRYRNEQLPIIFELPNPEIPNRKSEA
jgi:hypothetical protein